MSDTKTTEPAEITLKWGTLKGWSNMTEEGMVLLRRYHDLGASMSAMAQHDSDEQKQILVDLVSLPGMKIYLDWDGKYIDRGEAVKYITEYGKEKVA